MGGPDNGREWEFQQQVGSGSNGFERSALSRRRLLQLSSLGIAGSVLATPTSAQSLSRTLTIASNGGQFSYTVAVSGDLAKSSANGASIDPNDTISGSTATGQGGRGGLDSYTFSGELVVLDVEGDAAVTLNGEAIDPDDYHDSVVTIDGAGSDANYTLATSGSLDKTGANGASVDSNDRIRGSTATGQTHGGIDSYKFSGELVVLDVEGNATVRLNGEVIDSDDYHDSVVTIAGAGSDADYTLATSGSLDKTGANGASVNGDKKLWNSTATGEVRNSRDSYKFTGVLVVLAVDGNATVTLNGEAIDPDDYFDNVVTIEGTSSQSEYTLSTDKTLKRTGVNDATIDGNDSLNGTTAIGQVQNDADSYKFSGEITTLEIDGDATARLNGDVIDPDEYTGGNTDIILSIDGSNSKASYTFAVSGGLEKSKANGASLNSNDEIDGSTATGAVNGGTDSYAMSGDLLYFDLDGDATVTLDGAGIDPNAYNLISIAADSRADYTISVTSGLEKSAANGASINNGDEIDGSNATGAVNGGTDAYTFTGEIVTLDVDGDATVTVNGETVSDSAPSPVLGVHNGLSETNFETIDRMEEWQDARYPVQNLFVPWNPNEGHLNWLFGTVLPKIWAAGRIPIITWEPYTPGASSASVSAQSLVENDQYDAYLASLADTTPDDIEVRIADGEYDDYIATWIGRLQEWLAGPDGKQGTSDDRRAYIRFAHEMNGDWYPWSPTVGGSSASSYVDMWRHVHDQFESSSLDTANIQWMWCVNADDKGDHTAEQLYPGDDYVDWLSVDGYQWGTSQDWSSWESPESVFGDMLGRVRDITSKPVCIAENASSSKTSSGFDPGRKGGWIDDAFEYFDDEGVEMWCWFNEDKETDWAMFNGVRGTETVSYDGEQVNAYAAYRKGVNSYAGTGAAASGASPLTTAAFTGER